MLASYGAGKIREWCSSGADFEEMNQPEIKVIKKCPRPDLNRRQLDLQSSALPS
jgi:hypothetical protein